MKKPVLTWIVLFVIALTSCIDSGQSDSQEANLVDSLEQIADSAIQVTGVAIDGAMNSVYLKVGDDTIEFTYPDLEANHRDSWDINDTLTVEYYETANGDSVTNVISNERNPYC